MTTTFQMVHVVSVTPLGGFRLRVTFNDGSEGIHDFGALVNGRGSIAEPLRDAAFFARVFLEFGALTWPTATTCAPTGS